jgi:hypothetical protein
MRPSSSLLPLGALALTATLAAPACGRCGAKSKKASGFDAAVAAAPTGRTRVGTGPVLPRPAAVPKLAAPPRVVLDCEQLLTAADVAEVCKVGADEVAVLRHDLEGSGRALLCARFVGRVGEHADRIHLSINGAARDARAAANVQDGPPTGGRAVPVGDVGGTFVSRPVPASTPPATERQVRAVKGTSILTLTATTPDRDRKRRLCSDDQLIALAARIAGRI